jgi:hypothetical protein
LGKRFALDSNDLLEQCDGFFDLPVGLIGSCELVLRRETRRVVFTKDLLPDR